MTTPVTKDGPLGGFTTLTKEAAELDLMLTTWLLAIQEAADDATSVEDAIRIDADAHKLKREIIERYTPRSTASETAMPDTDEMRRLIATAATHLRTWATSTNKMPYANTMDVAQRLDALGYALGSTPSATATPIEEAEDSKGDWQCKDYADGWITFPTRKAAEKYQRQTHALMRYVRFYQHDEYVGGKS